ncbi:MAG TPA: sulfotransferase domain-containing protein [Gemmatimonadales bacterium]|jgi:hypothetical protein
MPPPRSAADPAVAPTVDFVIAGAQKAASSTLFELLRQHPALAMPEAKEVQFFSREDYYRQGASYLAVYRRGVAVGKPFGLADVQIMYFPEAPARLVETNPAMRAFVVLRNPIDRAYSAYWYGRWRDLEPAATFEAALEREGERATGSYHDQAGLTYLRHGHYAEQLKRLRAALGDRVMVLRYEELVADPAACARRAFAWLGVDAGATIDTDIHANPTGRPRVRWLQRLIVASSLRRLAGRVVPLGVKYWVRRRLLLPLLEGNRKAERYPPMEAATRRRLVEYYRARNAELAAMLGVDLSSWDR